MIRILHVLDSLGSGGAESFVLSLYKSINREVIQFDFLLRNSENNIYQDEVKEMGGKIYILPSFEKNVLNHCKKLYTFFKEHSEYKIIHVHASTSTYFFPLYFARKNGIPIRILHSHNAGTTSHIMKGMHYLLRNMICELSTAFFACSQEAGEWMCGDKRKFTVIHNAIDTKKFAVNNEIRNKMREQLNVENNFVIGHTGRFVKEKNHIFMIELIEKLYRNNKNIKLFFVGEGPLMGEMQALVREKHLENVIIFLGVRKDLFNLLQAYDLFLFPSVSEGLGIALIEAQASGLNCIVSEEIPDIACITHHVQKISLLDKISWIKEIEKQAGNCPVRYEAGEEIRKNGFDIELNSKLMENYYLKNYMEVFDNEPNEKNM